MTPLSYTQAEAIAQDLQRAWQGMTGQSTPPSLETITDVVQRVLRKAAEIQEQDGAAK